jgi:predicted nucleotide-binding protein
LALPIKTVIEDIEKVCSFLAKKQTGATAKEARAVIDAKHLDARKLSALRGWGFIEDVGDKMKLTPRGREYVRGTREEQQAVLRQIVQTSPPYSAIVERAAHRGEESISSVDVGAHWHDHFGEDVGKADVTLNDQAITFFNVAQGAGLGVFTIGRRGSPTRMEWDQKALAIYNGASSEPAADEVDDDQEEKAPDESRVEIKPKATGDANGKPQTPATGERHTAQLPLGQAIFLAHGRNKAPLEQLQKILRQFNVPFKLAVEEPNLGRPIGVKVREVMHQCNCAILIFTADECLFDKDGKEVWRPSENVGHELGACSFLYDNRIVILKEDKIAFPTNYRELGYISFSADTGLEAKSMDVLKELIGFGIIKIST